MQSYSRPVVREAVASLVAAALDDLAKRDGAPRIGPMPDSRSWWRYGQETFVALRPAAWHLPESSPAAPRAEPDGPTSVVMAACGSDLPGWSSLLDGES